MICLAVGKSLSPLGLGFWLIWTHSVERTEWREYWQQGEGGLMLRLASVAGSGAGMEPGEGARLIDGRWVWHPHRIVPTLSLAHSGATGGQWQVCADQAGEAVACRSLPEDSALTIGPCEGKN